MGSSRSGCWYHCFLHNRNNRELNKIKSVFMNKKALFLILSGALVAPIVASAQVTVGGMVHAAEQTALLIASGIVVILWIVTGVLFLTASGDPGKLGTAKKALFASVAGTVIVIIASSAIALVGSAFGL